MTKPVVNNRTDAWKTDVHLFFTITDCQIVRSRTLPHRINYKFMCLSAHEEKQRQAARTPNVVFVVASHYQSLQIVVLLLQACLWGSLALSGTLLLEQLQWTQQDRRFLLYTRVSSVVVWKQGAIAEYPAQLFTCVGFLWRTRYITIVAILIQWNANGWAGYSAI